MHTHESLELRNSSDYEMLAKLGSSVSKPTTKNCNNEWFEFNYLKWQTMIKKEIKRDKNL